MPDKNDNLLNSSSRELMEKGNQNLQAGLVTRAIEDYRNIINKEPHILEVRHRLVKAYLSTGQIKLAIAEAEWLGNYYSQNNLLDLAIQCYKDILSLDSQRNDIRNKLAELYIQQGNIRQSTIERMILANHYQNTGQNDKAIEIYREILKSNPENIDARKRLLALGANILDVNILNREYLELFKCYLQRGLLEKGLDCYNDYVHRYSNQTDFIYQFAMILKEYGENEHAERIYQYCADSYIQSSNFKSALIIYEELLKYQPEDINLLNKIDNLKKKMAEDVGPKGIQIEITEKPATKDYPSQIQDIENQIKNKQLEDALSGLINLVSNIAQDNNIHDAIAILNKYIHHFPVQSNFHQLLCRFYNELGDKDNLKKEYIRYAGKLMKIAQSELEYKLIEESLNRVIALDSEHLESLEHLLDLYDRTKQHNLYISTGILLAQTALRQNKYDLTQQICRKITIIDPANVQAKETLVEMYKMMNKLPEAVNELSKLADHYLLKQSFKLAILTYQKALQIDENNIGIFKNLITVYLQSGDIQSAIKECIRLGNIHYSAGAYLESILVYRRALELSPNNIYVHLELAKISELIGLKEEAGEEYYILSKLYRENGESSNAIKYLEKAINLVPLQEKYYEYISEISLSQNESSRMHEYLLKLSELRTEKYGIKESIPILCKIISNDPDNLIARNKLALAYKSIGQISDAVAEFERLAQSYEKLKQTNKCLDSLNKAMELAPNKINLREQLIKIYIQEGMVSSAIAHLFEIVSIYYGRKDYPNAIKNLENILKYQTDNIAARNQLADIYRDIGNIELAIGEYSKIGEESIKTNEFTVAKNAFQNALKLAPNNINYYYKLIELELKSGNKIAAMELYHRLGDILVDNEQLSQACQAYEEAIALQPDQLIILDKLSQIYIRLKEPKSIELLKKLGDLYWERGELDNSLEVYQRGIKIQPDNENLLRCLANLYFQIDKKKEGINILIRFAELNMANNPDNSIRLAQEILQVDSNHIAGRYLLAEAYKKTNLNWDAIREYFIIANYYLHNNSLDKTEEIYQKILDIDPSNIEVFEKLVMLYEKNNREDLLVPLLMRFGIVLEEKKVYDHAIEIYKKIIQYKGDNYAAYQALINLYQLSGQNEFAVNLMLQLADNYSQNNKYDSAITLLESAKLIQPANRDIYSQLIYIYEITGKTDELINIYSGLGELFEKSHAFMESADIYEKILELRPNSTDILNKLIELNIQLKSKDKAVHYLRLLAQIYRESAPLINKAIESLEYAREMQPDNSEIYQSLAEIYIQEKRFDAAIERLCQVAEIFIREGNSDNAVDAYQEILELNPDHHATRTRYADICVQINQPALAAKQYYLLAKSQEKQNLLPEAIASFKKVLEYNSKEANIYTELAELLQKTGALSEALLTYMNLGKHYLAEGNLLEAENTYRHCMQLEPKYIPARELLIELLINQNRKLDFIEESFDLADIYFNDKLVDKCSYCYQNILNVEPNDLNLRRRIAEKYLYWKLPEKAIAEYLILANIYEKRNDYDNVLLNYRKILEIEPGYPAVIDAILKYYLDSNDIGNAVELLSKEGEICHRRGLLSIAINLYEKAIEIRPDNPDLRKAIIECYRQENKISDADRHYKQLIDLYEKENQLERAFLICKNAVRLNPINVEFRERLADFAIRTSQPNQAAEQYFQLISIYESENNIDKLISSYDRYLKINAGDNETRQKYMRFLQKIERRDLLEEQYLIEVNLLMESGQVKQAIKYLKKSAKYYPDSLKIQLALGRAYEKSGYRRYALSAYRNLTDKSLSHQDYAMALNAMLCLIELEPDNQEYLKQLFDISVSAKNIDIAIQTCNRLVNYYLGIKNINSAISTLETIRNLAPEQLELREQLVELYKQSGNQSAAVNELITIAEYYIAHNKVPEAIKVLITSVQIDLTNQDIHHKLLKLYLETGQKEAAYQHYLDLSEIYANKKETEASIRALKDAINLLPDNPKAHLNLVTLFRTQNENQEALNEYSILAKLYENAGQLNEARHCYQQALEMEPLKVDIHLALIKLLEKIGGRDDLIDSYTILADIYQQEHSYIEAIGIYKKILNLEPANYSIRLKLIESYLSGNQNESAIGEYEHLANLYLQSDNLNSAVITYIRLCELKPQNKKYRRELIDLYRRSGKRHEYTLENLCLANQLLDEKDMKESIEIYKNILEEEPNNLHAANGLARAYVEAGNEKAAIKQFLFVNQILSTSGISSAIDIERIKHVGIELSPKFDFDNFVVGQHSNFAHAIVLAISKNPGKSFNPLFLYSEPGMGKTHLLNAIGNHIRQNHQNLKVIYTTSETFTGELINAIQTNTIPEFRNFYRTVDILLLEDIQFLSGKERAQEEFFHTFNTLIQSNKQVVITSDRPPKKLAGMENRLVYRFAGGVTVDIQKPDMETRIAILKQKTKQLKIHINDNILDFLGTSIDTNIREMEGALNKLVAYHQHSKIEITLDLTKNLLKDILPSS